MTQGQLTRRQALCAGAVTAAGAMALRAVPASADGGDGLRLSVQIERAPHASHRVYEVVLGAFHAAPGGPRGERTSEWADSTLAFRAPPDLANEEIHAWVAAVRRGRRDERDVVVSAFLPQGEELRYELQRCSPVAFSRHGFESGVGFIEVLTLAVGDVTSGR